MSKNNYQYLVAVLMIIIVNMAIGVAFSDDGEMFLFYEEDILQPSQIINPQKEVK